MSLNRRHDILHDIPVLLSQGGNRGEDSFRKPRAVVALIAETSLAPQNCPAQASFSPVVGRLHPGYKGKSEQCRPQLQEIAAQGFGLGVATGDAQTQQSPQTGPNRHQFPPHLPPSELARLITMPDGEKPFDLPEPPGSQRSGPGLSLGERLKISLQMRPADLALAGVHHIIGPPTIAVENAREGLADQLPQSLAASGARDQEDGRQSGYRHPQPLPFPLFLPTRFIQMRHLGLGHRLFGFPVRGLQGRGGLFAQTLDTSQAQLYPAQLLQQFNYLPAALAEATSKDGHPGLQSGTKGASANLGRQLRFHPGLTMGTPTGNQTVLGNHRTNFRQFPDLMSLQERNWSARIRRQQTPAMGTSFRPMLHDLIHFLRRRQLPMIALVSRLATGLAPTFFFLVFGSLGRVLGWRLRRIAGISIKPGLQLINLPLQLGNSLQRLAQSILQNQDISLNFWRKFFPSLWSNRSWFHKTLDTPFFT